MTTGCKKEQFEEEKKETKYKKIKMMRN